MREFNAATRSIHGPLVEADLADDVIDSRLADVRRGVKLNYKCVRSRRRDLRDQGIVGHPIRIVNSIETNSADDAIYASYIERGSGDLGVAGYGVAPRS
jgi:hypothetical protein